MSITLDQVVPWGRSLEEYRRIAEGWRPFRMWVCVLLMRHLGRSGAWNAPGLARERALAGRAARGRPSPAVIPYTSRP